MKQFSANLPITGTSITVTFPAGAYFVAEPAVLVTVLGAPTNVNAALVSTPVDGIGNVYTAVTLTFDVGAVGKRFSIMVAGD